MKRKLSDLYWKIRIKERVECRTELDRWGEPEVIDRTVVRMDRFQRHVDFTGVLLWILMMVGALSGVVSLFYLYCLFRCT